MNQGTSLIGISDHICGYYYKKKAVIILKSYEILSNLHSSSKAKNYDKSFCWGLAVGERLHLKEEETRKNAVGKFEHYLLKMGIKQTN